MTSHPAWRPSTRYSLAPGQPRCDENCKRSPAWSGIEPGQNLLASGLAHGRSPLFMAAIGARGRGWTSRVHPSTRLALVFHLLRSPRSSVAVRQSSDAAHVVVYAARDGALRSSWTTSAVRRAWERRGLVCGSAILLRSTSSSADDRARGTACALEPRAPAHARLGTPAEVGELSCRSPACLRDRLARFCRRVAPYPCAPPGGVGTETRSRSRAHAPPRAHLVRRPHGLDAEARGRAAMNRPWYLRLRVIFCIGAGGVSSAPRCDLLCTS